MDTGLTTEILPVAPVLPGTPLEVLYTKLILNTSLLLTINNLKTKGFNNSVFPGRAGILVVPANVPVRLY